MAEAIVSIAAERIADLLIREAVFLSSVKGKFEQLRDTLHWMRCFLKDADSKQDQDERIKKFVAEIRDVAYDAEDAIDIFLLKAASRRDGRYRWMMELTSTITQCFQLHKVGAKIDAIQTKIRQISTNMQTFGIKLNPEAEGSSSASEMQQRLRRSYPHVEEDHALVGLEDSKKDVIAQLITEDDQLRVVSIVGMGGLGKTTLAKKVYNDINLKRHFDCCCWAFISQQFSVRDVLVGMIKEVDAKEDKEALASKTEDELVVTLHNTLKGKRYLVVFDDIWTNEAWNCLRPAIPIKGKNGSKVLITTRIRQVALYADPRSSPVELPFLSDDDGWTLLRKIAIVGKDEESISPEFDKLGKEIVKRCRGLPLAVVVLGGLLANKKSLNEWEAVHGNINAQFTKLEPQQYSGVYWILALSYGDLPFHLKPCFLYLSQFPEGSEIHKREIIRMWIAEGFVSQPSTEDLSKTMEDVGEEYLNELVSRCMVQVNKRDHTGRGVKTFCIHDLMRHVCISMAKEEGFLEVVQLHMQEDLKTRSSVSIAARSRRIAVHCSNEDHLSLVEGNPCIRSLVYFVDEIASSTVLEERKFVSENYRLLRVLKLDKLHLGSSNDIPRVIDKNIHLRYLGLKGIKRQEPFIELKKSRRIENLPVSIGNMKSLYTLDLRGKNLYVRIPDVLRNLECLRHLLVEEGDEIGRIDNLSKLETLKMINAKSLTANDAMQKLSNLRNLGIWYDTSQDVDAILRSPIFESGRLRCLKLNAKSPKLELSNLKALSHCHVLTKLELIGKISEKNDQHDFKFLPTSLSKLTLRYSMLKKDPMPILEKQLPNLRFLELYRDAYKGSEMVCSADGFPQLEILRLIWLFKIEELRVEKGAMQRLNTLLIGGLKKLRTLPEGLKYLTFLKKLEIFRMSDDFRKTVKDKDKDGVDFYKVRHIPDISIDAEFSAE